MPDPGAALRAYVKLLRAHKAILARVEPRIVRAGLTMTQLGVLEALLHKGPMSQRALAGAVLTSAANMTDVIDKLARRDLVARCRDAGDRRSVRVALTEAGRALIVPLFAEHEQDIAAAMAGLGGQDLAILEDLLRRLGVAAALANEDAPDQFDD